jgi:cytoskeletal protein CcmA (bactofilin family)
MPMFRRRPATPTIQPTKLTSLIGESLHVRGEVAFAGGLRVDGHVEGTVLGSADGSSLLVLSDKGSVRGGVRVHDAVINGRIDGDLEVDHFLELQASACVTGNIRYRQLQLHCGATVHGRLEKVGDAAEPAALPPPATDPATAPAGSAAARPVTTG